MRGNSPYDVDAEMQLHAQDAVESAAELTVVLDYTPDSVERVEELLAVLHEKRASGQLPDEQVSFAALQYGAYIGEVIRRKHGGTWAIDHKLIGPCTFPLSSRGHEMFPVAWCGKRILYGDEDNVWFKFRALVLNR